MIEVTKVIEWDMGHRVPHHKNKCRHPHGHRYRLEATISGELCTKTGTSDEGMVLDFGDVKHLLMTTVHDALDHGFMVYRGDTALVKAFADAGLPVIEVGFIPTAENIVNWCAQQLAPLLPQHVRLSRLRLYETPNSWADWKL